jgi:hypothetical protein
MALLLWVGAASCPDQPNRDQQQHDRHHHDHRHGGDHSDNNHHGHLAHQQSSLKLAEDSTARALPETATEIWGQHLPGNADDLCAWCLEQSQDGPLDLMAHCAVLTVNAVQGKSDRPDSGRFAHALALAQALDLDMGVWFTPTAGNFFGKLTKNAIVDALREVKGSAIAPAWRKAKKADLASIAEREIAKMGRLPASLRRPA